MKATEIRKIVRENYGGIASRGESCCGSGGGDCCGGPDTMTIGKEIGYSNDELSSVPDGSNLGLGCGNPTALALIREGEVILDLGSGAGFDCFLAARKTGIDGQVIGVDMTSEMVEKARGNAEKSGYGNVEFRLGEIEHLPVADASVDLIISNCVINLSADKQQVFHEAFRVLKPGGRMMVSDIVLLKQLPEAVRGSAEAYAGCIAGASLRDDYLNMIGKAGFAGVEVRKEDAFDTETVASSLASVGVYAEKPV